MISLQLIKISMARIAIASRSTTGAFSKSRDPPIKLFHTHSRSFPLVSIELPEIKKEVTSRLEPKRLSDEQDSVAVATQIDLEIVSCEKWHDVNYRNPLLWGHFGLGIPLISMSCITENDTILILGICAIASVIPTTFMASCSKDKKLLDIVDKYKKD